VSIKPDGVRLYPIDIAEATPYFHNLHAWWVAQKTDRAGIGRQLAPRKPKLTTLLERIATAGDEDALLALWRENETQWTKEHTEAAIARKATWA
jgi:hypothetical protein